MHLIVQAREWVAATRRLASEMADRFRTGPNLVVVGFAIMAT